MGSLNCQIRHINNYDNMKDQLLNGETLELSNAEDMLEISFSKLTNKFHCIFNALHMHSSKGFASTKKFIDMMCEKHGLTLNK